jgi:WD40 repeat protein
MILDGVWIRNDHDQQLTFATAGRDKIVKLWCGQSGPDGFEFACKASITRKSAVTAISALSSSSGDNCSVLAVGEDDGSISLHVVSCTLDGIQLGESIEVDSRFCPSKTVHRLAWRPQAVPETVVDGRTHQLAVASDDGSVRILKIDLDLMSSQRSG